MKKRILAGVIGMAILVPSAVFASPYLADMIFGSVETIEQHGGTQEEYQEIEAMLQVAKGKLTEEEFQEYTDLTKQLMQLKLKITNENGVRDVEKLTPEEQQQWDELGAKLTPYFEKITGSTEP